MNKDATPRFLDIFLEGFIPYFLLGLIPLSIASSRGGTALLHALGSKAMVLFLLGLGNGTLIGLIALFISSRNISLFSIPVSLEATARRKRRRHIFFTGFICGSVGIVLDVSVYGVFFLTVLTLLVVWRNLKRFGRRAVHLLHPASTPTFADVGFLLHTYLTTIGAFTLINAAMDIFYALAGILPEPFHFSHGPGLLIDSLYFSTVVVTTLGFGDIVPQTLDAKALVIFECMTGYVIFALIIGIITKGIVRSSSDADYDGQGE